MNKTAFLYVDEHLISRSLVCPICLDILEDPYTHIVCDSAFCRSCLLQLTEPYCPICRWTWNDSIPLQYNIELPKSSRLIRNMLDDLLVQCLDCQKIFRRGEFQHECLLNNDKQLNIPDSYFQKIFRMILFSLILFLFFIIISYYRNEIFEKGIDRQNELIRNIGYNIDYILLDIFYYFILKFIEYSMIILILNICFWFSIIFYGDHMIAKTNNYIIIKKLFEKMIIINLIIYSVYN